MSIVCIAAVYFGQFADYPLVIAANRDEYFDRPSAPPGVVGTNPKIMAGKDLSAGGTWLGINEYGLLAGVLNRRVEKENSPSQRRSRGLLCLDVLRLKEPQEVCSHLRKDDGSRYRPFNLFFTKADEAYVAYDHGEEIVCRRLEKGLHILTNNSVYDIQSEKMNHAYPLFSSILAHSTAELRQPARMSAIKDILSDHGPAAHSTDPKDAICVHTPSYGTVSSSVIFYHRVEKSFYYYHAAGAPCRTQYDVALSLHAL